jgi:uncharacterized protein (TIGR04255 family)
MSLSDLLNKYERVVYERVPLVEVIVQIRFPPILSLQEKQLAELQGQLIDDFPVSKILEGLQFALAGPSVQPPQQSRSYAFSNPKTAETVMVSANSLTLTTNKYTRWEEFLPKFLRVLDQFKAIYKLRAWNRIGLRYRDVIDPIILGIEDPNWAELVTPAVAGMLASGLIEDPKSLVAASSAHWAHGDVKVILQTSVVENGSTGQKSFLIDYDFSNEGEFVDDWSDMASRIENLHKFAGPLFRWSISESLHNALKPQTLRAN